VRVRIGVGCAQDQRCSRPAQTARNLRQDHPPVRVFGARTACRGDIGALGRRRCDWSAALCERIAPFMRPRAPVPGIFLTWSATPIVRPLQEQIADWRRRLFEGPRACACMCRAYWGRMMPKKILGTRSASRACGGADWARRRRVPAPVTYRSRVRPALPPAERDLGGIRGRCPLEVSCSARGPRGCFEERVCARAVQ
jgi:hypothetical protein